jgi:uncharacterized membrane protein YidH (DUF202 family)
MRVGACVGALRSARLPWQSDRQPASPHINICVHRCVHQRVVVVAVGVLLLLLVEVEVEVEEVVAITS